jgi:predicted nucleotide-binding protein
VRLEPALNMPDKMLDEILDKLEDTLIEVDKAMVTITPDDDD